jgi:hypothetical protein
MINIQDKAFIQNCIEQLDANTRPVFGNMDAQQMLEHLYISIQLSMGSFSIQLMEDERRAAIAKRMIIETDRPLPMGFKTPALPDAPLSHLNKNLNEAKTLLINVLSEFDQYFAAHPHVAHTHPSLGLLNHAEWLIMHGKHFAHHFKQFGLL